MPTQTSGGMATSYEIEVRKADGTLFYQEASIMFPELPPIPAPPACYSSKCIERYKAEVDQWGKECKRLAELYRFIHEYHAARGAYCMRHKHDVIDEKYRTGYPAPTTIEEIKAELKRFRRAILWRRKK